MPSAYIEGFLRDTVTGALIISAPDGDALTLGESVMPRNEASNSSTQSNQVLRLGYFTAQKSETITQCRFTTTGTAAGATPTLIKYAVFTEAANGDLTRVAVTASDTALLIAANTPYPKAFLAAFDKIAGTRYAVGCLVVTAAAAPTIAASALPAGEVAFAPKLAAAVTAQADIAASYTNAQAVASAVRPNGVLLP